MPRKAKKHWTDSLRRRGACAEAVKWAQGFRTPEAAWWACAEPEWMLWLLSKTSRATKKFRLVAADIAEGVLHLINDDVQLACIWAIDAARRGDEDEMFAAVAAVAAAGYAAGRTETGAIRDYVAYCAAMAARAAAHSAFFHNRLNVAVYAATDATYWAYCASGSKHNRAGCDIIRAYFKCPLR